LPTDFNKLWAGQTVSVLGTALTTFALPTLAILTLHATAFEVGTLNALGWLSFPVLGLLVGVVADRYSRRKIMISADVVRFVALATVPLCAMLGVLRIPLLYGVALITGMASVFFDISYQSYLPVVVSKERLTDANVRLEFSNSGARVTGNALAGILVQRIGAAATIAFDALSYLASIFSLAFIRATEPPHSGPPLSVRQVTSDIGEGIRFVFGSVDLRAILFSTGITNLGAGMLGAVQLIYAYRTLGLQPGLLGVVIGFAEIGFLGALLARPIRQWLGLRATLITMVLIDGLGVASILLAQIGLPYLFFFLSLAVVAFSVPVYNVNQVSYRQALADVGMQGRMNATMRTFVWGTLPLGSFVGGILATAFGVQATIAISGAMCGLAALSLLPLRECATTEAGGSGNRTRTKQS